MPKRPRFEPMIEKMSMNRRFKSFTFFKPRYMVLDRKKDRGVPKSYQISKNPYGEGIMVSKRRYNRITRYSNTDSRQVKNMLRIRKKRRGD